MAYLWLCLGYLTGSCPTGYLVTRYLKGIDIRAFGSGNIGATNTGRLLGKKWAYFVAVVDMFKGGLVVLIASFFTDNSFLLAAVGVSAVIGHNYPLWLKFRGGKGVATTFGVIGFFNFFNPWPAIVGGCFWCVILKQSKYVSIASMSSLFITTLLMYLFKMPKAYIWAGCFLSFLAVWRHRSNIANIIKGTEDKIL